jgi:hypothetical protein
MRKIIVLTLFSTIFLSFIITHSVAFATNYYVATNGNNSYNGLYPTYQGGSNGPFKTVGKGIASLANSSSDSLYIRSGTYVEQVTVNKSGQNDSNRITISGYENETVTISGSSNTVPSKCSSSYLFSITGDWVTLQNIVITESGDYGLRIAGDNCIIDNVEVSYSWRSGMVFVGVNTGTATNCTIYNNSYSYNNCSRQAGYCGTWGASFTATGSSNITLENSVIYNNWGEGASFYNNVSNSIIQDNMIYDNGSVNLYLDSTYNCTAQRNILYYSSTTTGCGAENLALRREYPSSTFRGNAIVNNFIKGGNWPLRAGLSHNGGALVDTVIAYNTVVNDRSSADYLFTISGPSGSHSDSEVRNNIFYEEVNAQYSIAYAGDTTGIEFSNNLWSSPQSEVDNSVEGSNDLYNTNPLLEKTGGTGPGELSSKWFKLQSDSYAIDAGIPISGTTDDFYKISRPQGSQVDIGGDEYMKKGGDNQPPAPPTGLRIVSNYKS